MNESKSARQKAVVAAIGSVKIEGLNPTQKTLKQLDSYIEGRISGAEMRRTTIAEIHKKRITTPTR